MSISSFQEKFIKGGCGKFVLLFCGGAMVIGMAFSNCNRASKVSATDIKGNKERVFATVGDVEIPVSMVETEIDRANSNSQIPPDVLASLPPEYRLQGISSGVFQTVQAGEVYEVAKRQGFKNDDDFLMKTLHYTSQTDFENYLLSRAKKGGQLKESATIKDFEELVKSDLKGKTLKDAYADQVKEVNSALKDGKKRMEILLYAAQFFVADKFQQGINPTDEEVKKGFETYEIKRILSKTTGPSGDAAAKAKADKAYAELKAGKSFEDVMDAYTDDMQRDPKKKKSENVLNLSQTQVESLPDFKTVLKLQPGTFSEPEKVTEGYEILKYVGKKVDIPKDYEAKKSQYRQQNISQQVQKLFKAEIEKVEKDIKPTFEVKSYEAAYRYQKAMAMTPGPAQEQEFRAIFDLAKSVTSSEEKPEIAAMVQIITIQHLYDQPTADKPKLKADRIGALENYIGFTENWAYRKEVIDAYKEKGDKTKTFDLLLTGLEKNYKFDGTGQSTFGDMSAKFTEIKTAGLVSAEQEKQFRTKQDQWTKDKKQYDLDQERLKKEKAEDDKKQAEAAKKAAEEAKKNGKSTGSTLAPTGSNEPKK